MHISAVSTRMLTMTQNGPIHVLSNGSWVLNPYSWNTLADTVWMDQPVGAHFSTCLAVWLSC